MTQIVHPTEPMTEESSHTSAHAWTTSRVQLLVVTALMVLAFWLPRAFQLDHYVTIDEKRWLTRSANFLQALESGELQYTFQQGHPGVSVMWLGAAGYGWTFPDYARLAPGQFDSKEDELEDFLKAQGHPAIEVLTTGRVLVVLVNTLIVAGAFIMAVRLLGLWSAAVGFLLIAFDPFAAAFARYLHPDALLPAPMLLSLLAFLTYLYRGRRAVDLVISGVAAGFAWLTKTPALFLIPFVGLIGLFEYGRLTVWDGRKSVQADESPAETGWSFWAMARTLFLWGVIGVLLFVLFWPALWVAPVETLGKVLAISSEYAEEGHSNAIFFNGAVINGDPGLIFYPINFLWRATPVMLLGLLLALAAALMPRRWGLDPAARATTLWLLAFGLLFMAFMNLGAKKFDRYILPVYPVLDLAAGVGWVAGSRWLLRLRNGGADVAPRVNRQSKIVFSVVGIAVISSQALLALPTFPYYLSYYNPLLGGSARAPEVMFVGWGEGMDQAARYLNEQAAAGSTPADLTVATWYGRGPLSYFFDGEVLSSEEYWPADYAITYQNQWQRETPARQLVAHFERHTPEQIVAFDGIEYARIYAVPEMPLPDFVVDWGNAIRLISYELTTGSLDTGQPLRLSLYLQNLAPIQRNLNMLVRIVNAEGHEVLRNDGWPYGSATSDWQPDELWIDRYKLEIPPETPAGYYRVEIAFYDPGSLERWPVTDANTGELLGDTHVLDYVIIGAPDVEPTHALTPPADVGEIVRLRGFDLARPSTGPLESENPTVQAGDVVQVRLHWDALRLTDRNYTTSVQLLDPSGALAAQQDHPPLNGFIPMTLWTPGFQVTDDYTIEIPADAVPGAYTLRMGMYDPADVTLLPVARGQEPAGDSIPLATLHVTDAN